MASENGFYGAMGQGELTGFDRLQSRARETAVTAAVQLVADVKTGRVPYYLLEEALAPRTPAVAALIARNYPGVVVVRETMTRSDFPLLMGDVIDRTMLARWNAFPQAWRSFVGVGTRRDFRIGRAIAVDGLEGAYTEQAEEEELEYGALSETGYSYAVKKYAKGAKVSWEAILNDNLQAFDTIPDRLGRGAARTVARYVTGLYVGASGPNTTFFSSGNGNLLASNPVLSVTALQTAYGVLRSRVDADGEPIAIESAVLVVPPALEVTARNILSATQIWPVSTAGGPLLENWIVNNLTLVVDPYISIVATSNQNTSWFLFPDPNVARHAIEISFLAGYEQPVLYQKLGNTARVGGGLDQTAGDFATMAQEYKGVIAFGGSLLDPKSAVASNGSGS